MCGFTQLWHILFEMSKNLRLRFLFRKRNESEDRLLFNPPWMGWTGCNAFWRKDEWWVMNKHETYHSVESKKLIDFLAVAKSKWITICSISTKCTVFYQFTICTVSTGSIEPYSLTEPYSNFKCLILVSVLNLFSIWFYCIRKQSRIQLHSFQFIKLILKFLIYLFKL